MPDHNPIYNLLLHALLFSLLERRLTIRRDTRLPPVPHRRRRLVLDASRNPHTLQNRALLDRHELHVVVRQPEVEHTEACAVVLVRRRLHDAVDRALVVPSG